MDRIMDDYIHSVGGGSINILYAEDDKEISESFSKSLKRDRNYNILIAEDGKEGERIYRENSIDVIICDLEMPKHSGTQMIRKIREIDKDIPIIITTAYNDREHLEDLVDLKIDAFFEKPFNMAEVIKKLDECVEYEREKKGVAKEINFNKQLLERLLTVIKVGICITDKDGKFVFVNKHYTKIYGYKKEELLGNSFLMMLPEDRREEFDKLHKDFIDNKVSEIPFRANVVDKYGKKLDIIATGSRLVDSDGNIFKVTSVEDITEIIKMEEDKKEYERQLFQQSKMAAMGEMLGAIAHQWRQPLNVLGILNITLEENFLDGKLTEEKMEKHISKTVDQIDFMSKTIDDFKNFLMPDKVKESFSLKPAVQNVLDILNASFDNNKISYTYDDSSVENDRVYGLKNEIKQVFLNILNNAKDAIKEREKKEDIEGRIDIKILDDDRNVIALIKDNGGGIEQSILDRIFEPYFTTKAEGEGTGIGLYMSKMIVERSAEGTLEAYNEDDGAVFKIVFKKGDE
ncbi:MAG: response regulator [Campylobacterales bacterium]